MRIDSERRGSRRGSEVIEFALVVSFLLPFLFGTVVAGLNLGRSVQVTQISRDAGHMYSRGVDFSDTADQNLIYRLAQGLSITASGGAGVVILSTVTHIGQAQCTAASLSAAACTNLNQDVFTHRVVIGNSAARASNFGTPSSTLIDSTGRVSNYLTNISARANGFAAVLALQAGEIAYVSEVFVPSSDYGMPGFNSTGVYSRTIF
jgi:Flp pilus assembly protein TadG